MDENPKWILCTCSTLVPNLFSSRGFGRANVLWLLSRIPFPPLHTIFYVIERKWIYANHKRTQFIWPLIVQTSCFSSFFAPFHGNWQRRTKKKREKHKKVRQNLRSNALRNVKNSWDNPYNFVRERYSCWFVEVFESFIIWGGKKNEFLRLHKLSHWIDTRTYWWTIFSEVINSPMPTVEHAFSLSLTALLIGTI